MPRKTKAPTLDDRFNFEGDAVAPGDHKAFRAALFQVEEIASGRELTLKLWRKANNRADDDIRELWRHEMRQISRLMSYPGAADVIVNVLEFVEDETFFGVALDRVGQPLSEKRTRTPQGHWLRNLDAPRSRALFWRNIIRVVRAIGLIHAQGLVHGAVGEANVMSDGGELPDFQLAGFEWSLAHSEAKAGEGTHARVSPDAAVLRPRSYSFAEDWRCLGLMIGGWLERPASPAGRVLGPNGGLKAEANLSPGERRLLKRLLTPSRGDQLEAHAIVHAIEDVLVGLGRTAQTKAGSLVLAVDGKARLGDCVFDATDGLIAVDEHARQLDWLRAELDAGATLLVPPRFNPQRSGLRLVTAHAVCDLSAAVRDGVAAWDVAICTRVRRRRDALPYFEQEHEIVQPVRLARGPRDAERERQRLGPDALDWSAFAADVAPERDDHVDQVVDALFVAELIEAVVKASEAYPVEILARDRESGRPVVALRAQPKSEVAPVPRTAWRLG